MLMAVLGAVSFVIAGSCFVLATMALKEEQDLDYLQIIALFGIMTYYTLSHFIGDLLDLIG